MSQDLLYTCLECHEDFLGIPWSNNCENIDKNDKSLGFCSLSCVSKHNGLLGCRRASNCHGDKDERRIQRKRRVKDSNKCNGENNDDDKDDEGWTTKKRHKLSKDEIEQRQKDLSFIYNESKQEAKIRIHNLIQMCCKTGCIYICAMNKQNMNPNHFLFPLISLSGEDLNDVTAINNYFKINSKNKNDNSIPHIIKRVHTSELYRMSNQVEQPSLIYDDIKIMDVIIVIEGE